MRSSLQALRKAAGYKTAPEFAAVMDIPLSTYARYESCPGKIPLDAAWKLADFFGCSIDVIVEREGVGPGTSNFDIQKAYDALKEDSKSALRKYLLFLLSEDNVEPEGAGQSDIVAFFDFKRDPAKRLFISYDASPRSKRRSAQ